MILLRPVDNRFPITQKFGENPQLYPGTKGHNGIDYGLPEGQPVRAAADGQVIRAELDTETAQNPKAGYGLHVRIQHSDGSMTIYGHLSNISVRTGQVVSMGEVIGQSGNTGRSTGPHLHFELRRGVAMITAIDPSPFLLDEIPPEVGLFMMEILPDGDGLRIRSGPSRDRGIIRTMRSGERMKVFGITGYDVWLKLEDGYCMYRPDWVKIQRE